MQHIYLGEQLRGIGMFFNTPNMDVLPSIMQPVQPWLTASPNMRIQGVTGARASSWNAKSREMNSRLKLGDASNVERVSDVWGPYAPPVAQG